LQRWAKGVGMKKISRRRFIKNTAILGTAMTGLPTLFIPKARAAWARQEQLVNTSNKELMFCGAKT